MTEPALSFPQFLWIWNDVQGRGTPTHHRRMANWLQARWDERTRGCLLMAFRGSGKSTVVGVFCAWLLARHPNIRIMVVAAEHSLATRMVRNVKRILERHPATTGLKPPHPDQWAADQFTVVRPEESRDPSMVAYSRASGHPFHQHPDTHSTASGHPGGHPARRFVHP